MRGSWIVSEGENASDVKVFFIDGGNKAVQVDAHYDAESKCAVFETDHFSTWFVDATPSDESGSSSGGSGLILIVVAVCAIAIAAVALFFLMKTGKLGGFGTKPQ